jgi:hypothetical protein
MPFAAIYIPNFPIQAATRAEPTLQDRALVLIAGNPPLWSVVAASAAAQRAGIQLGMTKSQVTEFSNAAKPMRPRRTPRCSMQPGVSPHASKTLPSIRSSLISKVSNPCLAQTKTSRKSLRNAPVTWG